MRLAGDYSALQQEFNERQAEWNQAFRRFSDAQSKFAAHMRAIMSPAGEFAHLRDTIVAPVEDQRNVLSHVSLSFYNPMRPPLHVGPAPWFRITRNCVRQGPHDEPVAIFENSAWHADGERFTSSDVEGATAIQLDDESPDRVEVFGPFDFVRIANAVLWTNSQPLVKLSSETGHWQHVKTKHDWSEVVITPA